MMVDPVNLNVPGLPYLLFAVAFFGAVFVLMWVLSPLELLIRRHQRLTLDHDLGGGGDGGDDDNDDSDDENDDIDGKSGVARFPSDDVIAPTIDGLFGTVHQASSNGSSSNEPSSPTVYECRHCGVTLESGDEQCPRCETASVVRYETG